MSAVTILVIMNQFYEDCFSNFCPLCSAKLRPVFYYGLFGSVPPPETEIEMYLDPEGWRILEINPFHKQAMSNCYAIWKKHKPEYDMI